MFVFLLGAVVVGFAGVVDAHPDPEGTPFIAILARDGAAMNVTTFREVRALIAAVQPAPRHTFIFNGQVVPGDNAGEIRRVTVALDGRIVDVIDASSEAPALPLCRIRDRS